MVASGAVAAIVELIEDSGDEELLPASIAHIMPAAPAPIIKTSLLINI